MFRHRQQLQRWAARVLFLWLFGLGSGFANACVASNPSADESLNLAHSVDASALHHDAAAHAASNQDHASGSAHDGPHDHHGTGAKTNCQDFCGKATVSIPPLKSALDDVQAHALVATVFITAALPMPELVPVQPWVPRLDGAQAPPIPIAFLRLAL